MQSFSEIIKEIEKWDWYRFGEKEFDCPGLTKRYLDFYNHNNKLLSPCDKCYKALLFWEDNFDEDNVTNFLKLISSIDKPYRGKFDGSVVVFYFKDKEEVISFLDYLRPKIDEFNVRGKLQWRRACKEYQIKKPELWKNAKEFIPDINW